MANGDRIKYDYITGLSHNVTAEEDAVAAFLSSNKGDSAKVMIMKGADSRVKGKKRRERRTIKVDDNGKPKVRVSVFSGARRHLALNLKTDADIKAEKKAEALEQLWAERRARRAARNAETSES
jgi:hypothetical protein